MAHIFASFNDTFVVSIMLVFCLLCAGEAWLAGLSHSPALCTCLPLQSPFALPPLPN